MTRSNENKFRVTTRFADSLNELGRKGDVLGTGALTTLIFLPVLAHLLGRNGSLTLLLLLTSALSSMINSLLYVPQDR